MEYEILHARTIEQLKKSISEAIKNGWEPKGGVCVAVDNDGSRNQTGISGLMLQAMVRTTTCN